MNPRRTGRTPPTREGSGSVSAREANGNGSAREANGSGSGREANGSAPTRERDGRTSAGPRRGRPSHRGDHPSPPRTPRRREVSLDDKYLLEDGRVFLTGLQALVRVPLDQHRADRGRGLRTATFVSGYQGSPLGGLDKEIQRNRRVCEAHHLFHVAGLNEELGATSAWGSQLASGLPGAKYDGVLGMWYGKAPGLDRAMDSLRHGNYVGVSRTGGGLAMVGDDPSCKSSTIPSASEALFQSLHMPVFYPGSVQDVLDLGLHAFGCSRASGLWSGFKVITAVADGVGTADVHPDRVVPRIPELEWRGRPYEHVPNGNLLAPASLEMEHTMLGPRTELALAYARENAVNRIEGARDAWFGVLTAGKSYYDVRQALEDLGLDDRALERHGVRILKLGMIWPLEPEVLKRFADGLEEVLVVEEKRPFLEPAAKSALYGVAGAPRIVGKEGEALLPAESDLDADAVARALAARLARKVRIDSVEARMAKLDAAARGPLALPMAGNGSARTPFFCSGCPHNSSLKAPEGTLVGGGIGCHTMTLITPEGKGTITGITQMGGEGAQWIGMAPFTDEEHFVQNLGDGTFSHSGSLALRAAVAAGANVTYKLLYNSAVAMTGGQAVEGGLGVPDLTRLLEVEGVRRIIVTTEEPDRYKGVKLAPIAEVRHRRELLAAQEELAKVEGVTVLIHDQECAAELRRKRKRGKAPEPAQRVWINERVCEGCGDCGKKSSCLSVIPVDTEYGRKTQIHQASCNKDFSCLEGDCPSFVTVVPGRKAKHEVPLLQAGLPEPPIPDEAVVRMMGIGGTGVVTVAQILGVAALIDGKHTAGLDQTGLSQKGGPVVSDVRIADHPIGGSNKSSGAGCDAYLGFDLLGAASPKNLSVADPERTVAVVSTSAVPTGKMVVDTEARFPELSAQLDAIEARTRGEGNVYLDAQALSERLFGDHMPTNMLVIGAAYQRGLLPLSADAIEEAIRLNGAGVEKNLAAFAWGRACVAAPDAIEEATRPPVEPAVHELDDFERALVDSLAKEGTELRRLLELRVPELVAYQDRGYAERYAELLRAVRAAEEERAPGHTELTEAVARNLFKLMAYKDEYEVARLHLDAVEQAKLRAEFGDDAKVAFRLHPPLLRAMGLKRKLELGGWFVPAFRALRRMRRLRGTALDPFGKAKVRRVERELPGEYEALVREALASLTPESHATAVELAELPDLIRGYEEIKLAGVERFRERAAELRERVRGGAEVAAG
jgi:indolepyruvate ferredoxin oxidoreductase